MDLQKQTLISSRNLQICSLLLCPNMRVIILSDLNIHSCCPNLSSLTTDFINLVESFSLSEVVNGPTHVKGHTRDLVLSCGLPWRNVYCMHFSVSDHKAVIFSVLTPLPTVNSTSYHLTRSFYSESASTFIQQFALAYSTIHSDHQSLPVDKLLFKFDQTCSVILDNIAPFKHKLKKHNPSTSRRKEAGRKGKGKKINLQYLMK